MDKGQGMTSILGTLIASLAGGAQGGQNFQQGYMGSIAQQMERQQQDALMRQQWDMQNQRGRLGAEADYQGDMSQYYTGEANRIQGGIEKRQASQEKRELSLDDLAGQAMGGNIRNSRVLELRLGLLKTRGVPIPPELEATMRQGVQAAEAEDKAKADLEVGNKLKAQINTDADNVARAFGTLSQTIASRGGNVAAPDVIDYSKQAKEQFDAFVSKHGPDAAKTAGLFDPVVYTEGQKLPDTVSSINAASSRANQEFDNFIKGVQASGGVGPTDPEFRKAVQAAAKQKSDLDFQAKMQGSPNAKAYDESRNQAVKSRSVAQRLKAELDAAKAVKLPIGALPSEEKALRETVRKLEIALAGARAVMSQDAEREKALRQIKGTIPGASVRSEKPPAKGAKSFHHEFRNGKLVKVYD